MSIEEMNIKRKLEHYQIPAPAQERKEETRACLLDIKQSYQMTDLQFIFGQIGFIKPHTWIGQLAVLVLICLLLRCFLGIGYTDYRILSMVSTLTPMLLVFHIEEFARICYHSMLEIEMATKYSIKKLMLSRMCILGIVNFVMLGVFITFLNIYLDVSLFGILLYSLVPFNITVIGLFYLLKYLGRGLYGYWALSYTVFVCALFMIVPRIEPLIYSSDNQNIWMLVCIVSLCVLVKTIKETWKEMVHCEGLLAALR